MYELDMPVIVYFNFLFSFMLSLQKGMAHKIVSEWFSCFLLFQQISYWVIKLKKWELGELLFNIFKFT